MGLFDKMFGKKKQEQAAAPAPQPGAPQPQQAAAQPSGNPYGFISVDEDTWDDWETPQRMEFCKTQLEALKRSYGDEGKLKRRTGDDEVELQTTYQGRPVRVTIDYDAGWTTLSMKLVNRRGWLVLNYDSDKQPSMMATDGEWEDDQEEGQTTHIFAPGVYLEEYPYEAKPMIELWGTLPPALQQSMIGALQQGVVNGLNIDAYVIYSTTTEDIYEIRDLKGFIDQRFALFKQIADVFAEGNADLSPKPRVYIGGLPAQGQAVAAKVACSYCSTNYIPDDDPRCPNCGAPA